MLTYEKIEVGMLIKYEVNDKSLSSSDNLYGIVIEKNKPNYFTVSWLNHDIIDMTETGRYKLLQPFKWSEA